MSQRPSVESPKQSLKSQLLNPALQSALASLDVQLEEELVRYRRQRTGRSVPPRGLSRQQTRKTLDLISVGAVGGRTQPQTSTSAQSTLPASSPNTTSRLAIAPLPEPPSGSTLSSSSSATATLAPPAAALALASHPEESVADESSHNLIPGNFANLDGTQMPPDDYLESSEELLRSLAEEEAQLRVERGFMQSLLTPLGVGSMLLLLLSSATLGYIVMNPAILASLSFKKSPSSTTPTAQPQATTTTNQPAVGLPNSPNLASQEFVDLNLGTLSTLKANGGKVKPTTSVPAKPNSTAAKPIAKSGVAPAQIPANPAAAQSRSLPPSLPVQGSGSYQVQPIAPSLPIAPAPPPAAIYNPPAYNPPAYNPPASERPAPAPEPPQSDPAPAPAAPPDVEPAAIAPPPAAPESQAAAPSSPEATASQASGQYDYKVVTEYNGDPALEQAQKVVPDAYVRNFSDGARIQLGAFDDPSKADALVEQLNKEGIPAKVEQH